MPRMVHTKLFDNPMVIEAARMYKTQEWWILMGISNCSHSAYLVSRWPTKETGWLRRRSDSLSRRLRTQLWSRPAGWETAATQSWTKAGTRTWLIGMPVQGFGLDWVHLQGHTFLMHPSFSKCLDSKITCHRR